jgi:hypothetical protein
VVDSAASSRVVIIIRVWLEDHPEFPLRAVITSAPPDTTTAGVTTAVKTIAELCDAVRSIVAGLRLDDHR